MRRGITETQLDQQEGDMKCEGATSRPGLYILVILTFINSCQIENKVNEIRGAHLQPNDINGQATTEEIKNEQD